MELHNCRVCTGPLTEVLNLGDLYPSTFLADDQFETKPQPLMLAECQACGLVQLGHVLEPDLMYRNYWYQSGLNKSMLKELKSVVDSSLSEWNGKERATVLDIGANDGSMLAMYPKEFMKIGFDPALNLYNIGKGKCDVFVPDYFTADKYPMDWAGPADIVTAIAMFYDLNDPAKFLQDVASVMAPDGIFIVQATDLMSMLMMNAFDSICHEHVAYYKLSDLVKLFSANGLDIFNVEYNSVNGGSVRVYAHKYEHNTMPYGQLGFALASERRYFEECDQIAEFSSRVMKIKKSIVDEVRKINETGGQVFALGASTKGNTLLQYFGLDHNSIVAIGEVNKDKIGKRTVGTSIPIISEEDVIKYVPDVIIILPWHFRDFFITRLSDIMENEDILLLFPLPVPEYIGMNCGCEYTYRLRVE